MKTVFRFSGLSCSGLPSAVGGIAPDECIAAFWPIGQGAGRIAPWQTPLGAVRQAGGDTALSSTTGMAMQRVTQRWSDALPATACALQA